MNDTDNFKIEIVGRIIVIRFRGEIDMITSTQFDDFMRCNIGKYESFIIDMTFLEYFNSTGLGVILSYCKLSRIFIIPPVKKMLMNVMNLLEIGRYVILCNDMSDAFDKIKEEVV
jgi:anti-anti-sigma factor